ncbi:CBS domain-containing protein [Spirillospora sp. NPDC048911]|uniref:CBS domain-containing protein n=1 Tax=Spirillospora sp. NPDC048911 TaxID=3364527 RepID=UPI003716E294
MSRSTVREFMTDEVVTARPDTSFRELVEKLEERQISGLPVVDDESHVLGVVSEIDLLKKEAAQPLAAETRRVARPPWRTRHGRLEQARADGRTAGEVMSTPPVTVGPETKVVEAARLLTRHGYKRLPVVDDAGRLIGIVSRADLLRVYLRPDTAIRDEVIGEVIVRSLWQDPDKVDVEVDDGEVTLRGRVEQSSLVPIAEKLTAAIDGVVDVRNELAFERDDSADKLDPQTLRHWR